MEWHTFEKDFDKNGSVLSEIFIFGSRDIQAVSIIRPVRVMQWKQLKGLVL